MTPPGSPPIVVAVMSRKGEQDADRDALVAAAAAEVVVAALG